MKQHRMVNAAGLTDVNTARVIGTDEQVRVVVRLPRHALVIGENGAAWLQTGRVTATVAECARLEVINGGRQ